MKNLFLFCFSLFFVFGVQGTAFGFNINFHADEGGEIPCDKYGSPTQNYYTCCLNCGNVEHSIWLANPVIRGSVSIFLFLFEIISNPDILLFFFVLIGSFSCFLYLFFKFANRRHGRIKKQKSKETEQPQKQPKQE